MEKYYCIYIYISWKYNFNWKKKFILWERYSVFIKLKINLDETTVTDSFIQLHEFEEDTPISCITNIQFWFRLSNFLVELYDNFTTIFKQSLNNFKSLEYTWIYVLTRRQKISKIVTDRKSGLVSAWQAGSRGSSLKRRVSKPDDTLKRGKGLPTSGVRNGGWKETTREWERFENLAWN